MCPGTNKQSTWVFQSPGATARDWKLSNETKKRATRRKSNAISVVDVARAAGVSTATVSRVLNGNARVAAELQNRVRDIAQELGYTPHAAARALASQRSKTIGA